MPNTALSKPEITWGSNHIRYLVPGFTLRLTSDVPVRVMREGLPFLLDRELHLVLGPDETTDPVGRRLRAPVRGDRRSTIGATGCATCRFRWNGRSAVIRSAITLKLCQYDETGAIVAAMTTSIPEAANTVRNWDYRYCWLRDSAFVVRALNRLGATRTMEEYLRYVSNVVVRRGPDLQPLYGIGFETELAEEEVSSLAGYRGMGPVRRGNLAWLQQQHDVYGSVVLASTQLFFDQRLLQRAMPPSSPRAGTAGRTRVRAARPARRRLVGVPRTRRGTHLLQRDVLGGLRPAGARSPCTSASDARSSTGANAPTKSHARIIEHAYNEELGHFVEALDGNRLDASLLLLADLGFVEAGRPALRAHRRSHRLGLKRGDALFRYVAPDDFGVAGNQLHDLHVLVHRRTGRDRPSRGSARSLFERILDRRNPLGLLSEDLEFDDGEAWGNFPQTYSHVGLINAAMRLSRPWQDAT